VDRDGKDLFRVLLTNYVFVEMRNDFTRSGNLRKELFAGSAPASFLFEDRLAELDAFAADIDIAGPFDQGSYIAIALSTKRTERVFFGGAAAPPTRANIPT
jgi:hypothetical protein